MNNSDQLIITAASRSYGKSLLALLGLLTLNWSQHPPVLVYDIGLDEATRAVLRQHNVNVKTVPPFCPHWRKHYTWKVWCWYDAPARDVFWIDAGIAVLQPLDEIFETIARTGYFVVPDGGRLMDNVSVAMCRGCGLDPVFREFKDTMAGGMVGFRREGVIQNLLNEAILVALTEEHMTATEPLHRFDQALLSLLLYKYIPRVQAADASIYLEGNSPRQTPGQKIWVHRRAIRTRDAAHFAAHISKPGAPYLPKPPLSWRAWLPLYRVRRWLAKRDPRWMYIGVRD